MVLFELPNIVNRMVLFGWGTYKDFLKYFFSLFSHLRTIKAFPFSFELFCVDFLISVIYNILFDDACDT